MHLTSHNLARQLKQLRVCGVLILRPSHTMPLSRLAKPFRHFGWGKTRTVRHHGVPGVRITAPKRRTTPAPFTAIVGLIPPPSLPCEPIVRSVCRDLAASFLLRVIATRHEKSGRLWRHSVRGCAPRLPGSPSLARCAPTRSFCGAWIPPCCRSGQTPCSAWRRLSSSKGIRRQRARLTPLSSKPSAKVPPFQTRPVALSRTASVARRGASDRPSVAKGSSSSYYQDWTAAGCHGALTVP